MKINSFDIKNNIVKTSFKNKQETSPVLKPERNTSESLPAVNKSVLVQPDIPVSYKKIGEIPIAGIEKPASVFKLSNGQTVVILPKKGKFYIETKFNVGSDNETYKQKGISHCIEHNLFGGSKNLNVKEFDDKINKMGGESNAETRRDVTKYYLSTYLLEDNTLEECIKLNASLTQYPKFDKKYFENEKGAIKSEIDDRNDNETQKYYSKNLSELYNYNYNFHTVLGSKEHIDSFTVDMMKDYYNTYCTPDNCTTLIMGDVDINETMNLVSKYFNKKSNYTTLPKRKIPEYNPTEKPIRKDYISKTETQVSNTFIALALPKNLDIKDENSIDVLIEYLNSPATAADFHKKLDDLNATIDISREKINESQNQQNLDILIKAPEENTEKAIDLFNQEITKVLNDKSQLEKKFDTSKMITDDSSYIDNIYDALFNNDFKYTEHKKESLENLTYQDFLNSIRKNIDLNKTSITVLHTKNTTKEDIENNYKTLLKTKNNISFTSKKQIEQDIIDDINSINSYYLPNNFRVNTIQTKDENSDKFCFSFDFYLDEDKEELPKKLDILNILLIKNNTDLLKEKIKQLEEKGKSDLSAETLSFDVFSDSFSIDSSSLAKDEINSFFSTLKQTLENPNFDEKEFEKIKKEKIEFLKKEEDTVIDKVYDYLYPGFRKSKEEKIKILENTTLDDIKRLYASYFNNCSVEVTVMGDFKNNPDAINLINSELMKYPAVSVFDKTKDYYSKTYKPNQKETVITNAVETKKANVDMIFNYPKLKNIQDIVKIDALNSILSERLMQDLRYKQGLVYDVGSFTMNFCNLGQINLSTSITTDDKNDEKNSSDNINKVLESYKKITENLKISSITEEELTAVKNKMKSSILDNIEVSDSYRFINHKFDSYNYLGKNHDLEKYRVIDKLTVQDIQDAAKFIFKNPPVITIEASQKTLDEFNNNMTE